MNLDLLANLGWSYPPCLVNLSNVICVGGTDSADTRVRMHGMGYRLPL